MRKKSIALYLMWKTLWYFQFNTTSIY